MKSFLILWSILKNLAISVATLYLCIECFNRQLGALETLRDGAKEAHTVFLSVSRGNLGEMKFEMLAVLIVLVGVTMQSIGNITRDVSELNRLHVDS